MARSNKLCPESRVAVYWLPAGKLRPVTVHGSTIERFVPFSVATKATLIIAGLAFIAYLLFAYVGWFAGLCFVLLVGVIGFFMLSISAFAESFVYTDKDIENIMKGFLGYDFGKEYEVVKNETRVHGDRPVKFEIKIPQEAMKGVKEYCSTVDRGNYSEQTYTRIVQYKSNGYVERKERMCVKFDECTIEFSGVSF